MEWLIGGFVVWFIYRILTVGARSRKYFMEAVIWRTGGIVGTGVRDIHKAVSLFTKASNSGLAQASFELGALYEDGWSHPTSSNEGDQLAPNGVLSSMYFLRCHTQSPDVYTQLENERRSMKEDIEEHIRSMMLAAKKNREDDDRYVYEFEDEDEDEDEDEIGEEIALIIAKASLQITSYQTNLNWHKVIRFVEQSYEAELSPFEGRFHTIVQGRYVMVRIMLNEENGYAVFDVS